MALRKKKSSRELTSDEKKLLAAYYENEYTANKQMIYACTFAAAVLGLLYIGYLTRIFRVSELVFLELNIATPVSLVLLLFPWVFIRSPFIRQRSFKYFIFFLFLLAIGTLNTLVPKHAVLAYAIPIILVNHYYNPRMGRVALGSTLVVMLGCMIGSMYLGEFDPSLLSGQFSNGQYFYRGEPLPFPDNPAGRAQYLAYLMDLGENRFLAVIFYYFLSRAAIITVIFFIAYALNRRTGALFRNAFKILNESERAKSELSIANDIQQSSLPNGYFIDDRIELVGELVAAKEVGGDFFDYFFLDDTHIALIIGDVSGKGVPAAMFMMRAITCIRSLLPSGESPSAILSKANTALRKGNANDMFVTAFLGILDVGTGVLKFANAGHNPPLITRNKRFLPLPCSKGFLLGAMEQSFLKDEEVYLKPGDTLVLYTDGVTEARNAQGEFYGESRLVSFLNKKEFNGLIQLHRDLDDDIGEFVAGAEPSDDKTLLVLRMLKGKCEWKEKDYGTKGDTVAQAVAFIRDFAASINMNKRDVNSLSIIADEMISNIVKYAYPPDEDGWVHVRVHFEGGENLFTLTLIDSGAKFNQLSLSEGKLEGDISSRQEGGLGILIVKNLIEKATYGYLNKKNILTLSMKVNIEK